MPRMPTKHPPDTPPDSMDGHDFEYVLGFVQLCLHAVCVWYHVLMVSYRIHYVQRLDRNAQVSLGLAFLSLG